MSVAVIDDHALLADTITLALRLEGLRASVVAPSSVPFVVEEVAHFQPSVALVDLDLGRHDLNGLDLIGPLVDMGVEVVAFTNWDDPLFGAASIECGAIGFVAKSSPFGAVLAEVRRAIAGEQLPVARRDELKRRLRERRQAHADQVAPFESLTPRERDVLVGMIEGRSAAAIAEISYVSLATVRSQIRAVLNKLAVNSQLEAVAAARHLGWSSADAGPPVILHSSTLAL